MTDTPKSTSTHIRRTLAASAVGLAIIVAGTACGARDNGETELSQPGAATAGAAETPTTAGIPPTTTTTVDVTALTSWADRLFKWARVIETGKKLVYVLADNADVSCQSLVEDAQEGLAEMVAAAPDPALGELAKSYFIDVHIDASMFIEGEGCLLAGRKKGEDDPHEIKLLLLELEQRGVNLEPLGVSSTLGLGIS
jgi:hypothetical protein